MRLGMTLFADRDVAGLARLAARAESTGFDDVWWPDHYMHRDIGAILTACALATTRVRLGSAVTSPLLRHPAALASLFASLAEIAPGRIVAGVGPGGWELPVQLGIHEPRPLTLTRHAARILAELLSGEPATAPPDAARFPVTGARLDFAPPRPVPLYLAARGPRMMTLAGEVADGLITHSLSLPFIEHVIERVQMAADTAAAATAAAAADTAADTASADTTTASADTTTASSDTTADSTTASADTTTTAAADAAAVSTTAAAADAAAAAPGRRAGDCSIAVWLEVFLHDDVAHARDVLRPRCRYMVGGEFDPSMIPLYGLDPAEVMQVRQAVRRADPAAHELITDDMVDAFTICGSVERAADRIDALRAAGVSELILSFGHGATSDEIASVGDTVLGFLHR